MQNSFQNFWLTFFVVEELSYLSTASPMDHTLIFLSHSARLSNLKSIINNFLVTFYLEPDSLICNLGIIDLFREKINVRKRSV